MLLWVALTLSRLIQNFIRGHSDISPRAQVLLGKVVRFTMITVAVVVALTSIGLNFAALAVFTGALGVGIGIGLQNQVSNLLSGLFLLLDKSIKPGDVIEVGATFGWVKDMRARYVGVVTRDNKELLIPNDDFVTNQVINWSHSDLDVRKEVEFGVAYESDPHEVRRLAVEAAMDAGARIVHARRPVCHVKGFGDSSLDFVLRFWINDPQNGVTNIKGQVLLALWDKFNEHGIEIPTRTGTSCCRTPRPWAEAERLCQGCPGGHVNRRFSAELSRVTLTIFTKILDFPVDSAQLSGYRVVTH